MKKLLVILSNLALFLFFAGCITNRNIEQWEGISADTLKISISEFFPLDENAEAESSKIQIKERLNQRASLLIASYITINLPRNKISESNDQLFNKLISEIISNGKVVNIECSENYYCSASSEYNISELKKSLEQINKQ